MKQSKYWIIKTFFVIILLAFIYPVFVYFFFKTPQYSLWIHNVIAKKENSAKSIHQPKIILLGGSATLFGLRAKDIQETLSIPTINMGLHAGLGLKYMLYRAQTQDFLHPKDVLIFIPEYGILFEEQITQTNTFYFLTYDRKYFNQLPLKDKIQSIYMIKPRDIIQSFKEQLTFKGKEHPPSKGYNSSTLNQNGDETINTGSKEKKISTECISFPENIDLFKKNILLLTNMRLFCQKNNIDFYISYPNLLFLEKYNLEDYYSENFLKVHKALKQANLKIIGYPKDFFYEMKYFYE